MRELSEQFRITSIVVVSTAFMTAPFHFLLDDLLAPKFLGGLGVVLGIGGRRSRLMLGYFCSLLCLSL